MAPLARGLVGEARRMVRGWRRPALLLAPFLAWAVCVAVYSQRLPRELRTGVLDLDRTSLSRTLVRDLEATPTLDVVGYTDLERVQEDLRRGRIRAAVVVPRGTDEAVREGRTARISLLRDATRPLPATQIYQAVANVVGTESARLSAARLMRAGLPASHARELAAPLRLDGRPLGNPWLDYLRSFAPALLPMFLQMGMMLAGATCAEGGRRRPRLWSIGRAMAWAVPSALAGGLLHLAMADSLTQGSAMAGSTIVLCLASALVGLGIARRIGDPRKTVQILLVSNTPAFVFSGFTFPEWAMPRSLELLTRPMPYSLWFDVAQGVQGVASGTLARGLVGLFLWLCFGSLLALLPAKAKAPNAKRGTPRALIFPHIPGLATLVLLGPPGYLALYGSIYAEKAQSRVPIALVAPAPDATTRAIGRSLAAHHRLDTRPAIRPEAMERLRSGEVRAVLEIPSGIGVRASHGRSTSLPLLVGADRFLVVGDLQRAVSEVLADASTGIRAELLAKGRNPSVARELATPLALEDRPLGNPAETYGDAMLPIVGLLIAHQLLLVGAGLLASSPRASTPEAAGKTRRSIAFLWLWFTAAALAWLSLGLRVFDVPVNPDPVAVAVATAAGLLGAAAMGSVLGRIVGDGTWWLRLAAFSSYPLFFLSGASWPLEASGAVVRLASWLDPMGPLLDASDRALRSGASLGEVAPMLGKMAIALLLWAVIAIGAQGFASRKSARRRGPARGSAPSKSAPNPRSCFP